MDIPSCQYLELMPPPNKSRAIRDYVSLQETGEMTPDLAGRFLALLIGQANLGGALYKPWCTKRKSCCIVMESPVTAMGGFGDLYQAAEITLMNGHKIGNCEDRIPRERDCYDAAEFVIRHAIESAVAEQCTDGQSA